MNETPKRLMIQILNNIRESRVLTDEDLAAVLKEFMGAIKRASQSERPPGFYWVLTHHGFRPEVPPRWVVAELCGRQWYLTGGNDTPE